MSIYREIEDTDKVFGRVRKVSSGLFSSGFEITDFYFDTDEIKSEINGWVQTSENITEETQYVNPSYDEYGTIVNYNEEIIDSEETLQSNSQKWSDVSFGDYYVNVYNEPPVVNGIVNDNSTSQFSISYGHKLGHGSLNSSKSTSITQQFIISTKIYY